LMVVVAVRRRFKPWFKGRVEKRRRGVLMSRCGVDTSGRAEVL
jgi:hypothetical protein